jgi:hypothetical protein
MLNRRTSVLTTELAMTTVSIQILDFSCQFRTPLVIFNALDPYTQVIL